MKEELLKRICKILDGIDKTQSDDSEGWWETSTGAEFGENILRQIQQCIEEVCKKYE